MAISGDINTETGKPFGQAIVKDLETCMRELDEKKEQVRQLEVSVSAYSRENLEQQKQIQELQKKLEQRQEFQAQEAFWLMLDREASCLAILSGLQRIAPEHNGIIGTDELYELRDKVRDLLERVRLRDAKESVPLDLPF